VVYNSGRSSYTLLAGVYMQNSKRLWRVLLFLMLTAALCGSFAFKGEYAPVVAALQAQATLCSSGTPIVGWTFQGLPLLGTTVGTGTFTSGSSLLGPSTLVGPSGSTDVAVNFSGWSTDLDDARSIRLDTSTVGFGKTVLSFDYRVTPNNGPSTLVLKYSSDGTNFKVIDQPRPLQSNATWQHMTFDLSSVSPLSDTTTFRIYAFGTSNSESTVGLDNIVLCASPTVVIDSIEPNPTNGITKITWHSLLDGTYQIRLNGSSCTDGQTVISAPYTGPDSHSDNIDGKQLVEGTNIVRVCVTDQQSTEFAVGSIIKDMTGPSFTVTKASGQAAQTNFLPIRFSVIFSEPIDAKSFDPSVDISQKGTATGITWTITNSGDNKNFTLQAVAVNGAGTLIPSIDAGKVSDELGNPNINCTNCDGKVNLVEYTPSSNTNYHSVIINEIAWSGTKAGNNTTNSNDEWIELYNTSPSPIDLSGWTLKADDSSPTITLPNGTTITGKSYFLLARNAGTFKDVTPDFIYGDQNSKNQELRDGGEILRLKNKAGAVIDVANAYSGYGTAKWAAGTGASNYASMERGSYLFNYPSEWVTFAGTPTVHDRNGNLIYGTPGEDNWINSNAIAITTIIFDTPDPSLVNQFVSVTVTVVGGVTTPSKTVAITGANTNCTFTLSSGMGSCSVKFTSAGTKTITATYSGDGTHPASTDTESHTVRTTNTIYPTLVPTALPPPPLLALNEFVPRPGHDWNNDGVVNVGDEYIEVLNHGVVNVNLSGYSLDDEVNVGSEPYRLPALTLRPGERHVFYGSETGLLLGDGGDGVRLLKPNGQLADAYNYSVVERPDQSYCRLPDNGGADDWNQNCYPTPGLQNSLNEGKTTTANNPSKELYCPISDTLPADFALAECEPFGNEIWRPEFWDRTGWYGDQYLPGINMKWPVFAN
jgi:hypothetical protein